MRRKREERRTWWWGAAKGESEGEKNAVIARSPEEEEGGGGKPDGSATTTTISNATAAPNKQVRIEPIRKDVEISGDLGMIGARINAWPRLLDWVHGWVSPSVLLGRLSGTVQALVVDDLAIRREGGVAALVDEEVKMAMDARGQDVLGKEVQELRDRLEECVQTHSYLLKETRG